MIPESPQAVGFRPGRRGRRARAKCRRTGHLEPIGDGLIPWPRYLWWEKERKQWRQGCPQCGRTRQYKCVEWACGPWEYET